VGQLRIVVPAGWFLLWDEGIGTVIIDAATDLCGYRFDCGALGTFSQVCAYGTACLVEKID
jgi:hypothetical protein